MVVQGTPRAASEAKIVNIHEFTIGEMKKSSYPKMIIKFSSEQCPPCKRLQKWLQDEYKPVGVIPIYHVSVDNDQNEECKTLGTMYSVRSIPFLVFTDKTLTVLDSITGFDKSKIEELINKHFGK